MRIVLDINVLVSGIISKNGPPGQLLSLWRERLFVLVVSQAQIDRMKEVLLRPRLQKFVNTVEVEALIADISNAAEFVEPDPSIQVSGDPEDDIILGTAVAGRAAILVSGDEKHLLPLKNVEGVQIISPTEAIAKLISTGN